MLHKGAAQVPELASRTSLVPGDGAPGGEIAVQFLTLPDDLARLAPEWNRIHAQATAASVFNSWLFQYQWWQVYGAGQPLRILVALERGETVGILALYIQKLTVLGLPVRELPGSEGDLYRALHDAHQGLNIEVQKVDHPSRVHLDIETNDHDRPAINPRDRITERRRNAGVADQAFDFLKSIGRKCLAGSCGDNEVGAVAA